MTSKLETGVRFPTLVLAQVGGGNIEIGATDNSRWQLLVVYRGRHCPISQRYLTQIDAHFEAFEEADTEVIAVSADPADRAEADRREFRWRFVVGYGLTIDRMRDLGLYISAPRNDQESDRPFAEPALFLIRPDGTLQFSEVSSAPFVLPDLNGVLSGLRFVQRRNYPPRGTLR